MIGPGFLPGNYQNGLRIRQALGLMFARGNPRVGWCDWMQGDFRDASSLFDRGSIVRLEPLVRRAKLIQIEQAIEKLA
jgi:hypothetical protein